MRPLPDKLEELEDLLLNYRDTLAQNTGVPFIRLVYRPDEEVDCRRLARSRWSAPCGKRTLPSRL